MPVLGQLKNGDGRVSSIKVTSKQRFAFLHDGCLNDALIVFLLKPLKTGSVTNLATKK